MLKSTYVLSDMTKVTSNIKKKIYIFQVDRRAQV